MAASAANVLPTSRIPLRKGLRVAVLEVADGEHVGMKTTETGEKVDWPHDAQKILLGMEEVAEVKVLKLRPNARQTIGELRRQMRNFDVFVNLYDLSDETGMKITQFCAGKGFPFTGTGSAEHDIYDPPRRDLKLICRSVNVWSPLFAFVEEPENEDFDALAARLGGFADGGKIFVKPEHGFDSVGVSDRSACTNVADLRQLVSEVCTQFGGALVEQYIPGREFSVLVTGWGDSIMVLPPVEYVFDPKKPAQFITYSDKWESYSSHWKPVDQPQDEKIREELIKQAKFLYENFDGAQGRWLGLARFDVRLDSRNGKLYFLDINPNPSMFYEDGCTCDSIISFAGVTKTDLMRVLLQHAFSRSADWELHNRTFVDWDEVAGSHLHAKRDLAVGELVYTLENEALNFCTKEFVSKNFSARDKYYFDHFGWPLGDEVFATWHTAPGKWRPINHSCDPNCWMYNLDVLARKPIKKGEELTIDYATFIPSPLDFECWCKTPLCRKDANGFLPKDEYKLAWFQNRYCPGENYSPHLKSLLARDGVAVGTAFKEIPISYPGRILVARTELDPKTAEPFPHDPPASVIAP
jgi:D-alanine-D-alanine ligase-like ATP-grasp enzyme